MATTVHIPPNLLAAVDERAGAHRISRNRFVIRALEKALEEEGAWSAELLEALDEVTERDAELVDEMVSGIERRRRSKEPVKL